jgi:hypothetical protein
MKTEPKFDRYTLASPEARQRVREQLEGSGVEYEIRESEDIKPGCFRLYFLDVRRVSPTLKERLSGV